MTTLSALKKIAPEVSGLAVSGDTAGTGNLLNWVIPVDGEFLATEVWTSVTNNRSTATLLKTVNGNSYLHVALPGQQYFYWIRGVNIYQQATGNWHPTSETGGVGCVVKLIKSNDIEPGSISISAFSFNQGEVVGSGGSSYVSVASFVVANPHDNPLPFTINHNCQQVYSGGAVDTKWILRDYTADVTIADWGTFTDKVPLVPLSVAYVIPPNTSRTIVLFWYGADNTVLIKNRSIQMMGLIR